MPPAKVRPITQNDSGRSESSAARERVLVNSTAARKGKGAVIAAITSAAVHAGRDNGSGLKEVALASTESGEVITPSQGSGIAWSTLPLDMLDSYRMANSLATPAAFSSGYSQLALSQSAIARQSPTMARRRDKRRVPKEYLATAVRKHFNGAAVNELDVVVDLAYKAKTKGKAFRLRSGPLNVKR